MSDRSVLLRFSQASYAADWLFQDKPSTVLDCEGKGLRGTRQTSLYDTSSFSRNNVIRIGTGSS